MPLAALSPKLTVVSGMKVGTPNSVPHYAGAAGFLSGAAVENAYGENTFSQPSIDQVIAQKLGDATRFKSIECGAEAGDGLSYNGPSSRNPPERSPHALFERLFGAGFTLPGEKPLVDPTVALRRSILDAVTDDATRLKKRLGKADQVRLDQHLEGVRALEKRLARLEESPPNLAACKKPTAPLADYPDVEGRPMLAEKNAAFAELLAMSLACDQTRVFSVWHTMPVSNHLFPSAPAGHHQLTHDEAGDQPAVNGIVLHCVEAYATLLRALDAVKEGDGTLLDHCVVLGTSDVSLGKTHSLEEFPILLAGGCGGKLKPGLHYRSPSQENASKVPLSLVRAMGIDAASFGAGAGQVTDGLSAIEV